MVCPRFPDSGMFFILSQDRFLDSLHSQNMESHKDVLAEVGIDVDDIEAPDLCVVGEYLGPTGELSVVFRVAFRSILAPTLL